jgi:hypothetical protein
MSHVSFNDADFQAYFAEWRRLGRPTQSMDARIVQRSTRNSDAMTKDIVYHSAQFHRLTSSEHLAAIRYLMARQSFLRLESQR